MTRNSIAIENNHNAWTASPETLPLRLPMEGVIVSEPNSILEWIKQSSNPDTAKDFLDAVPHRLGPLEPGADFAIGNSSPDGNVSLYEIVNGENWIEKRMSMNPPGNAIPPREDEGPVDVWNRMLGVVTKNSTRVEIIDRYLLNNFKNFPTGESPLEQIFSECLSEYRGEIRLHCGRPEEVQFSHENAARRLRQALPTLGSDKGPKLSVRLCFGRFRGQSFAHDRWLFFAFTGGPGVCYSLGKGVEDIHGTLDIRVLSEHLAPRDWAKLSEKTRYLEDRNSSSRLNRLLSTNDSAWPDEQA